MSRLLHGALAIAVMALAIPARADDASEAQAEFERGARLYRQRHFEEAITSFLASNRLVPNANVVYNIAVTYELLGRPVEAYNWVEQYLLQPLADDRRALGRELRDRLAPSLALVDVTSAPPGAEIYVDRIDLGLVGRTPLRIAVAPGDRRILLRLEGHRDGEAEVRAAVGQARAAAATLARRRGALEVISQPAGADVIDVETGAALGHTPLSVSVPVGERSLRIARRGRLPEERRVVVRDGARASLSVALRPDPDALAVLSIRTVPARAEVHLDGRPAGRTPLSLGELEPQSLRVRVEAPGRRPWRQTVSLEPGGATRLTVRLAPAVRDTAWWRWLGYGGGGALTVVGASLGLIGRLERDAFFEDPQASTLEAAGTASAWADVLLATGLLSVAVTLVADLLRPAPASSSGVVEVDR